MKSAMKRSRTDTRIPTVVDAIAHSDALPDSLRSLLKTTLPIVLNTNKVERHTYENEVVGQAQTALGTAQKALEEKHAAAAATQNNIISPAERVNRTKAKSDAEAHSAALKAKLEANKAAKKTCEKGQEDAEAALKAAQKDEKVTEKEMAKINGKKEALSSVLATEFAMLKDGTSASAAGKKAVKKLIQVGKESGVDSTLLATLPITCAKPVDSRSEFETMMFPSLQGPIDSSIQDLAAQLAAKEPEKAAKAAAVAAAQGALQQAKDALKAADDELTATQTASKEAIKAVHTADAKLRGLWEEMRKACEAQDSLAGSVKDFKEKIWVAFNELKEKEPEPEPVEEPPAAEEEAPAAAEAAPVADTDDTA